MPKLLPIDWKNYDGPDKIVSSHEMELSMADRPRSLLSVKSKIPLLDRAVDGFRTGELIVISGPTKQGKTLLAQSLTLEFTKQQQFPLWFSYEVPMMQFLEQFPELPLFFVPQSLRAHAFDWLDDRIEEAHAKYNTRIIFIDHLHYLFDLAKTRNPSIDIGAVIRRLKSMAVTKEYLVFLLCHTTKGKHAENLSYESIRDCIPAGQMIQSPNGISFTIEDAKRGMYVFSRKSIKDLQSDRIMDVWNAGKKDVYKLTTKTGREILASSGHKFYAMSYHRGGTFGPNQGYGIRGWTELKNLNEGQKIACVRRYDIDPPPTMDENQALVLGWIVGDGHITKKFHAEITVSTVRECEILKTAADMAWNLVSKYTKYPDKNAFRFYLSAGRSKNNLKNYFQENGFNPIGDQKHTPREIFTQSRLVVAAYLRGLFQADGSINFAGEKKNPMVVITLSTISAVLALEVKSLLLRFGIVGSVRKQSMNKSGFRTKTSSIFVVSITGQDILSFMEEIGFLAEKMDRAKQIVSQWKPKARLRKWDICYERIKSIEYVGKMDTYDVSVRGHHQSLINNSFCVQDIITHNSSFVSQESDCTIMIRRTPQVAQNAAELLVEFHRRTGVMEVMVPLQKIGGYLRERAKEEPEEPHY